MVVAAPTRESVMQIQREAERFRCSVHKSNGIGSVGVYGVASHSLGPQLREMRQGRHLIVGTPGALTIC